MRILTSVLSILALTLAIGCSDDDGGGGGGDVDAAPIAIDATVADIDAALPTSADGQACTATEADPTGGCPTTHGCLNSKCTEICNLDPQTMMPDQMVCPGYSGPGESFCLISVTAGAGMPVTAAGCLITCENTSGMGSPCPTCDGTCPNTYSCMQHPNPMAPAGFKVCQ